MNTLLVQDGTLRTVLGETLGEHKHSVTLCSGLHQAKHVPSRDFFPLVVVDLASVQETQEFLRFWKARHAFRNYFILVVIPSHVDVGQFTAAGASDFLLRPYDLESVRTRLHVVEAQCKRRAEWEHLEEALRTRAQQQAAVAALGLAALTEDLPMLVDLVSRFVVDTLEVEFCGVFELDPEGKSVKLGAGFGWKPDWFQRSIALPDPADPAVMRLLGEYEILSGPAAEDRSPLSELLQEHGVEAGIRVAIKGKQAGTLGILGAFTAAQRSFREDDLHFLQGLANTIAAAHERRRAEAEIQRHQEQVQHLQRLESVGQLTAALAHDYNNVLTVIHGHLTLSLGESDLPKQVGSWLRTALEAVEQASTLTQQLLSFSRKQPVRLDKMDLDTALSRVQRLLRGMLGARIKVDLQVSAGLPQVMADERQLDQVLLNLAANARDAMPSGGTLLIQAALEDVEPGRAREHPNAHPGPHIRLSVKDTGCGMNEQTMRRVFEPFFTTKAPGKGTGLGLSTVYGIVRQHQGWVEIESKVGSGTAFRIYLPLAEPPPAVEPAVQPAPPSAPGRRRQGQLILLVEDDPILRQLARLLLEELGHPVLDAASAAEALAIWQREQAAIEILVTDLVLPDATGFELARLLLQQRPGLKVICTSGYSSDSIRIENPALGFRFVQKPYNKAALAEAIESALNPAAEKAATIATVVP